MAMEPVVDELIESLASFRKKLEQTPVGGATESNVNMFDTSERDQMRENNQDFVDRFKKTFDKTPLSVESKKSEDNKQSEKKITLTTTKEGNVDQRTKEYKQLFEQIKTKIDSNNVKTNDTQSNKQFLDVVKTYTSDNTKLIESTLSQMPKLIGDNMTDNLLAHLELMQETIKSKIPAGDQNNNVNDNISKLISDVRSVDTDSKPKTRAKNDTDGDGLREIKQKIVQTKIAEFDPKAAEQLAKYLSAGTVDGLKNSGIMQQLSKLKGGGSGSDSGFGLSSIALLGLFLGLVKLFGMPLDSLTSTATLLSKLALGSYKGALSGVKNAYNKFKGKITGKPTTTPKPTTPKPTPPKTAPKPTTPKPTTPKPTPPKTAPPAPKTAPPEPEVKPKPKTTKPSPLRRDGTGMGKAKGAPSPASTKPGPIKTGSVGDNIIKSPFDKAVTETTQELGEQTSKTLTTVSKEAEELAAKKVSQEVAEGGTKIVNEGVESAVKAGAAKGAMKGLSIGAKTLPFVGALISAYSATKRFEEGDYFGSSLDAMSAIANASGPFTLGIGTALSLAIDAGHIYLDMSKDGNKIKNYINRLGADTEEMKAFAEGVAKRTAELRQELDIVVPNLKNAEDVLAAANKAADAAGGNEYEDRTEDLRDDLLDNIKKHGSDVDAIYKNLSSESKIAMTHLEDSMNSDYKQIIGNLLKKKKSISYKSQASVGGGWSYTPSETRYRTNDREGEELFEAANALGIQSAGLQVGEERKTAAMLEMTKQFESQGGVKLGEQDLKVENGTIQGVLNPESMKELQRLRESDKEADRWFLESLEELGIKSTEKRTKQLSGDALRAEIMEFTGVDVLELVKAKDRAMKLRQGIITDLQITDQIDPSTGKVIVNEQKTLPERHKKRLAELMNRYDASNTEELLQNMDAMAKKPGYKGEVDSDKKSFMDLQIAAGDDIEGYLASGQGLTPEAMASSAHAMEVLDQHMTEIKAQQAIVPKPPDLAPQEQPGVLELSPGWNLDLRGSEGSEWNNQLRADPAPTENYNQTNLDIKKSTDKRESQRVEDIIAQNKEQSDLREEKILQKFESLINNSEANKSNQNKQTGAVLSNTNNNVVNITQPELTLQDSRGRYRNTVNPLLGN